MNEMKKFRYEPLDNTNICVEFWIYKYDLFDVETVVNLLEIKPTDVYIQKPKIDENDLPILETSVELKIGYEESYDINNQINQLMELLLPKKEILKMIVQKYEVKIQFMIVINIEKDEWPAMYLHRDFIKFVSEIDGEIQFDPYYY